MPCCERHGRYIDNNDNIKPDFIQQAFGEGAQVVYIEDTETDFAKFVYSRHGHYPGQTFVKVDENTIPLCTCDCHKEGSFAVMH